MTLKKIAYRNIWRNLRRTILCIAAVGIAVFFNIFMQSMMDGMIKGIEDVVRVFDTGHVNVVSSLFEEDKEYYPVQFPVADGRSTGELIREIEAVPGVKAVLPRINAYATLSDSLIKHAFLWGIDIDREKEINNFNLTDRSDGLVTGRYPQKGSNECAIGVYMAKKAGLAIGDRIPLKVVSAQFSDKYWSPEIVGIFEYDYRKYDEQVIMVSFDRLQKLLVLDEGTQQLFIYADNEKDTRNIAGKVKALLGDGNVIREWQDNYWVVVMQQSTIIFVIIFLVFQIVASFLIINTVVMIIHERIKEIGMMGALGMTRSEIVMVFFFEAVFLSIIGSLAGCIVGGLSTWIGSFFPISFDTFTGGGLKEFPMAGTIFLNFSPVYIVQGFLFGVIISAICTIIPSLKSAFIEPVEALRR
ncbi:ABC transporter permease [Brucepastera parasyntrophica]|uniref:ABC transporter permease n=1 Tax=Brucepastera parasyntrophica TaxID=2880008 RepID=UPI00210DB915|nr:FtsX-like permease family protein [Brucepastera parasyntrophica]ULQ61214.1 ABC transporter permease [Brucepastera parasyntrophica]